MTDSEKKLFDRELSWLQFNARVLTEAMGESNALFERLKFLGIVSSNFDEFFMVRMASLKQDDSQTKLIRKSAFDLILKQYEYFESVMMPQLKASSILQVLPENLDDVQLNYLRRFFRQELFPILTPIAVHHENPMPVLTNLSLYLIVALKDVKDGQNKKYAAIEIPRNIPRMISLPQEKCFAFILLEDVISLFAKDLFVGFEILEFGLIRLTRAMDMTLDEEKDEDFVKMLTEALKSRRQNSIMRCEIKGSEDLVNYFTRSYEIAPDVVFGVNSWFDLKSISQLAFNSGFENLKRQEWIPKVKCELEHDQDIWDLIKKEDIVFHHPYDSFETISKFIKIAAEDPSVLAIKQTLYRTGNDSPVVASLERAAENGKQVTVLVELKARFDEGKNIEWSRRLENAGASVIYGVAGFKVHAKICLVVRREAEGIKRYVHLSTGNYNQKTASLYTDIGLLTCDEDFGNDASSFFHMITGYSQPSTWSKIAVAPHGLRSRFLRLIVRETMRSKDQQKGLIMAKMNSLVDPEIIEALYRASQAGVKVKLNVRGVCCLRPGVPGLSDNIEVVSIVDMFLEHSRMYYFANGGDEELYLSSADWMPRNLDRRIEILFPVDHPKIRKELIDFLKLCFEDNLKSWRLSSDGTYQKDSAEGKKKIRLQEYLMQKTTEAHDLKRKVTPQELRPRKAHPTESVE